MRKYLINFSLTIYIRKFWKPFELRIIIVRERSNESVKMGESYKAEKLVLAVGSRDSYTQNNKAFYDDSEPGKKKLIEMKCYCRVESNLSHAWL